MEVRAMQRYLRMPSRKVRLVADLVRGIDVKEADHFLQFTSKKAALHVRSVIRSATANAVHNHNLKRDSLYIKEIFVDSGPSLKRSMPRAQGRAYQILKRTCHIVVVLDERLSRELVQSKQLEKKDMQKGTTLSTTSTRSSLTSAKRKETK